MKTIDGLARAMMRTTDIGEHNDIETVSTDWCGNELWSVDFGEMARVAAEYLDVPMGEPENIEQISPETTPVEPAEPDRWADTAHTPCLGAGEACSQCLRLAEKDYAGTDLTNFTSYISGSTSEGVSCKYFLEKPS